MHESFRQHNVVRSAVIALVLTCVYTVAASQPMKAQTTTDSLDEVKVQLEQLQNEFNAEQEQAAAAVGTVPATPRQDFFSITSVGLWLLWALLSGVLLLLAALRRNIQEVITGVYEGGSVSAMVDEGSMAENGSHSTQTRSLVKPEKIVKIKVRKIRK